MVKTGCKNPGSAPDAHHGGGRSGRMSFRALLAPVGGQGSGKWDRELPFSSPMLDLLRAGTLDAKLAPSTDNCSLSPGASDSIRSGLREGG